MNKIEKLHESIRTLFRSEGETFCYTPGEIERLVCSLNYKQLYSVLCDTAEPVYVCCAGGGICDSHQYHSTKLFPAHATLIWSDEGEPLGDDNLSTSYSNELWLLEDMTIAAVSCFRVLNSAASYITEYREYKCRIRILYHGRFSRFLRWRMVFTFQRWCLYRKQEADNGGRSSENSGFLHPGRVPLAPLKTVRRASRKHGLFRPLCPVYCGSAGTL